MALRRFQYVPCSDIPYLNMYDVGDVIFMMKRSWIICPPNCSSEPYSRTGITALGVVLLFVPAGPTDCRSVRDIHGREVFGKVMCPRCAKPLPAGRGYR